MGKILGMLLVLACSVAGATMKVAVIDSGFTGTSEHLCATGHYNFINETDTVGPDTIAHGTYVLKAIETEASGDYCLLVYKIFNDRKGSTKLIAEAISRAVAAKVDVINLSIAGKDSDDSEKAAISSALNVGIKVFVASGNEGQDLDKTCNIYPACYKLSSSVVGTNEKHKAANYSGFTINKQPYCYQGHCGTSFSTGYATGKFIKEIQ